MSARFSLSTASWKCGAGAATSSCRNVSPAPRSPFQSPITASFASVPCNRSSGNHRSEESCSRSFSDRRAFSLNAPGSRGHICGLRKLIRVRLSPHAWKVSSGRGAMAKLVSGWGSMAFAILTREQALATMGTIWHFAWGSSEWCALSHRGAGTHLPGMRRHFREGAFHGPIHGASQGGLPSHARVTHDLCERSGQLCRSSINSPCRQSPVFNPFPRLARPAATPAPPAAWSEKNRSCNRPSPPRSRSPLRPWSATAR